MGPPARNRVCHQQRRHERATLYSFTGGLDGGHPYASLTLVGSTLYGTTYDGGTAGTGTVFAINSDGTNERTLYSFTGGSDGGHPYASLTLVGATLYGTTPNGGTAGDYGTVFAINSDGTNKRTLYSFTGGSDGHAPFAALTVVGSTLYGTTYDGGTAGEGTVFAINSDGTNKRMLYSFTGGPDGGNPYARMTVVGSTLYGTTYAGGTAGEGTVFAINSDGTNERTVYSFTHAGSDGAKPNPFAALTVVGSTLYGTTYAGGTAGAGAVFAINRDGTNERILYSFTGGSDGGNPYASLTVVGSTLYGTTYDGGTGVGGGMGTTGGPAGDGTVFAINSDGTNERTLVLIWTSR